MIMMIIMMMIMMIIMMIIMMMIMMMIIMMIIMMIMVMIMVMIMIVMGGVGSYDNLIYLYDSLYYRNKSSKIITKLYNIDNKMEHKRTNKTINHNEQ